MYPNVPPADQTTGSRAKPSALLEGSVSSPMTLFITPEKHAVNPGNRALSYIWHTNISVQKTTKASTVDPMTWED